MSKRLFRKTCSAFSMARCLRFRVFVFLLGIVSLASFTLVYNKGFHLSSSYAELRDRLHLTPTPINKVEEMLVLKEDNGSAACKLPVLDPFHPSVVKFMKDLGKLRCEGKSYSSFENNVLRVEGEDIVSAQYRKIERPRGDDGGVVLSDPVKVQNTNEIRGAAKEQKGEIISCLKLKRWTLFITAIFNRVFKAQTF